MATATKQRMAQGKGKTAKREDRTGQQQGEVDSDSEMQLEPVASTSRQTMEESDDGGEDDVSMNDGDTQDAGTGYTQYMGDSEVEDSEQELAEDAVSNDSGQEDSEDEEGSEDATVLPSKDLELLKEEMQKIPLKTLLRAQKRLNSKSTSKTAADQPDSANSEGASTKKSRQGREASRRGMAPDLLKPRLEVGDGSESKGKGKVKQHRDNKHAPTEMSSKRTVSRNRAVVEVQANTRRDPRFDNLTGAYDPQRFQESYAFLGQARQEEIKRLQYALRATKRKGGAVDAVEREAMAQELAQLHTKQAAAEKEQREKAVVRTWKEQESKKQGDGKKSFFLKSAERKKILEDSRMQDLQKNKRKLRKVMDKKKSAEKRKDFRSAPPMRQM